MLTSSCAEWAASADAAFFLTRYKNLLEFSFDQWGAPSDPLFGFGFKSINITDAQIGGVELSMCMRSCGKGKTFDMS